MVATFLVEKNQTDSWSLECHFLYDKSLYTETTVGILYRTVHEKDQTRERAFQYHCDLIEMDTKD